MVHTFVDGTYRQTNLTTESPAYLAKREELRLAEIELMRQREHIAELRRNLPEGAAMQDYRFEEGPRDLNAGDAPVRNVSLSELFTAPDRALVIYHFMFGKKQTKPCPMCRRSGLNCFRIHARRQGSLAPLLHSPSKDGPRHSAARHRPARSDLALHGPDPAGPRQLVRQPFLRYQGSHRREVRGLSE